MPTLALISAGYRLDGPAEVLGDDVGPHRAMLCIGVWAVLCPKMFSLLTVIALLGSLGGGHGSLEVRYQLKDASLRDPGEIHAFREYHVNCHASVYQNVNRLYIVHSAMV